jgi:hypothetical protein
LFILLHEISISSADRERHARQNCLSVSPAPGPSAPQPAAQR